MPLPSVQQKFKELTQNSITMWMGNHLNFATTSDMHCGFNGDYYRCYDKNKRRPVFALEKITKEGVNGRQRSCRSLIIDGSIVGPHENDFSESEYTKGHLVAKSNHRFCSELYRGTCLNSNICPEVPNVLTKHQCEKWEREMVKSEFQSAFRLILPHYETHPTKMNNEWDVPSGFVEVVFAEDWKQDDRRFGSVWFIFYFPNSQEREEGRAQDFLRSLESVQQLNGFGSFSLNFGNHFEYEIPWTFDENWREGYKSVLQDANTRATMQYETLLVLPQANANPSA